MNGPANTDGSAGLKGLAKGMIAQLPLSFWKFVFPKSIVGLCYHLVSDEVLPHAHFYDYKSCDQFEADVSYACERHSFVTYEQLIHEAKSKQRSKTQNRVAITFDDGYAECYRHAHPIMQKYGAPGIFFVNADFVDNNHLFYECKLALCFERLNSLSVDEIEMVASTMLAKSTGRRELTDNDQRVVNSRVNGIEWLASWSPAHRQLVHWITRLFQSEEPLIDQFCEQLGVDPAAYLQEHSPFMTANEIRELHEAGHTIGAHTNRHANLNDLSDEAVEQEIVSSCDYVRQLTGQKQVPFAFPYNGADLDRAFLEQIQRRNPFVWLYFDTGRMCHDAPFVLNRIGADQPPTEAKTNVPELLRDAWCSRKAWKKCVFNQYEATI